MYSHSTPHISISPYGSTVSGYPLAHMTLLTSSPSVNLKNNSKGKTTNRRNAFIKSLALGKCERRLFHKYYSSAEFYYWHYGCYQCAFGHVSAWAFYYRWANIENDNGLVWKPLPDSSFTLISDVWNHHKATLSLRSMYVGVLLHKHGKAEGQPRVVENRNLLSHPDDLRKEAYLIRMT